MANFGLFLITIGSSLTVIIFNIIKNFLIHPKISEVIINKKAEGAFAKTETNITTPILKLNS